MKKILWVTIILFILLTIGIAIVITLAVKPI